MSVNLNVPTAGTCTAGLAGLCICVRTAAGIVISVKTQFSGHAKIRFISQLINGRSKVPQNVF